MNNKSIVYTNDNCIGCNKCIKVCSAIGACISKEENGKARIEVDENRCVACGSCIDVCAHGAREFNDDTERFFDDLKKGEKISLLLAPAFKANFPDEYESALGGLKDLGVNRIISVSFGADITTWGYLNYIKKYNFFGGISQPCPAVVSYIEKYLPGLIPKLFPVQSPLMCAAIYARKEMGITDKFAFISPCIAKKLEIEDPHNDGLVQYNVTFEHLMNYMMENGIEGSSTHSEIEYGLGSFYPTPGGLAENVRWFLGDDVAIRQIEGERHLYEWLHYNQGRIEYDETPFTLIDALNCEKGCICGTAVDPDRAKSDDALYALLKIRGEVKKNESGNAWSRPDTPEERLKNYNEQFKDLSLDDYLRGYTDRSANCGYGIPDENQLDKIFISMNKLTDESRMINCTCCGYESCEQMAIAIHNGFNHKENCIYYEKAKVHELALEKAIAEESSKAKSSFLANMSHEIRTPINAILGMNEMVLRESTDENVISYSQNIKNAGKTLLGLVSNILDFSKIETGRMEIEAVDYDLSSVINDLVNTVQVRADEKKLKLELDIDPKIPKGLHGDEIRIKQIITNLLTNAVKYTEEGSVTLRFGFERPDPLKDQIDLKVAVEDTGIGIKKEDISRLFEKFDRIEEKRNRNIEGTGLGMNITKMLLELMNSELQVESTYGEGSKFSFVLRQDVTGWDELGDYETAYRNATIQKKSRGKLVSPESDVLVIDDNSMNLVVFKNLLKQTKINIDTADSGDEGLVLAGKKKYDIIFFDHMMPDKDGIETLVEMRSSPDNPNIGTTAVCLTANAISGARDFYLNAGFDDYMSKPVDPEKLEKMLIRYLPEEKIHIQEDGADEGSEGEAAGELDPILEPLINFDGIDVNVGIMNSGSADDYLPLLRIFYETMDEKAEEIQNYLDDNDIKDYTIKVHALKSSARLIGAVEFGEKAQILENAGKKEDLDYIGKNHKPFMEEFAGFKIPLSQIFDKLAEEQDANKPEADEGLMSEVFNEIKAAAEDMDCDLLQGIFTEMEEYKIPDDKAELFKKLSSASQRFDYDAIIELLS
ncbi:MAG: response regulator [Lachnospiraceae bacterium]|nr:response regulator [Lachnospiraceae bacterium]